MKLNKQEEAGLIIAVCMGLCMLMMVLAIVFNQGG